MSKAQVSLEFLILMAAFFAFLAAWLPVLAEIKSESERAVAISYARESAARLVGALDDVCILGGRNVREVDMRIIGSASIEAKGKYVFVVGQDYAVSVERLCSTSAFRLDLDGPARLRIGFSEGGVEVQAIN